VSLSILVSSVCSPSSGEMQITVHVSLTRQRETVGEFAQKFVKLRGHLQHLQGMGHLPRTPIRWSFSNYIPKEYQEPPLEDPRLPFSA